MNAVRVAVGVESFWGRVRSLDTLALILRTCKSVRAECGVAFAVAAMGRDRRVQKAWARRWLGVRAGWWARGGAVTLVGALRLAAERGSLRGAEAHRVADAGYMRRLAAFRRERARRAELHAYFERRMERRRLLERAVTEAGLATGGLLYERILLEEEGPVESVVARLRAYGARKAELDGRVPVGWRDYCDHYYVTCLLAVDEPVTDAMVAEIAFRGSVGQNRSYVRLVARLREGGRSHDAAVERARDALRGGFLRLVTRLRQGGRSHDAALRRARAALIGRPFTRASQRRPAP